PATTSSKKSKKGTVGVEVKPGSVLRFTVAGLVTANDMLTISGSLKSDPSNTGVLVLGDEVAPHEVPVVEASEDMDIDG
ncbi:hypothetical protein HDV05_002907, partial [Chytridiales sp. JEL 0842]